MPGEAAQRPTDEPHTLASLSLSLLYSTNGGWGRRVGEESSLPPGAQTGDKGDGCRREEMCVWRRSEREQNRKACQKREKGERGEIII